MSTDTNTKQSEPPFHKLARLACTWMDPTSVWGEYAISNARGLRFTDNAKARFGQVVGFIHGLASAGQQEVATKMAEDFVSRLDYLANYGGRTEIKSIHGYEVHVPNYLVRLHDDGTFGGFSLCWFQLQPTIKAHNNTDKDVLTHRDEFVYKHVMNGGLLATGVFGDNSAGPPLFSVNIGPDQHYWSIHT